MTLRSHLLNLPTPHNRPGLLVSVRDSVESLAALAGGADVIDVKEPNRGPLGRADGNIFATIVASVGGRTPVSAAFGELVDFDISEPIAARGLAFFKFGLAGCALLGNWQKLWRESIARIRQHDAQSAQPVAVVYADWRAAAAPAPEVVLATASEIGCPVLLVDTWNKADGTLFQHWAVPAVQQFVEKVRTAGLAVVLAGSLDRDHLVAACQLQPDLLAVRGAACEGGRAGRVTTARVRELKDAIAGTPTSTTSIASAS